MKSKFNGNKLTMFMGIVMLASIFANAAYSDIFDEIGRNISDWQNIPHYEISIGTPNMLCLNMGLWQADKYALYGAVYLRDEDVSRQGIIGNSGIEIGPRVYTKDLIERLKGFASINLGISQISGGAAGAGLIGPTQAESKIFISPNIGLVKAMSDICFSLNAGYYIYGNGVSLGIIRLGVGKTN